MATLLIHTNSASAHPHLSPFPDRQLAHLRITSHAHRSSSPSIAPSPHPNSTHSSLLELAALPTPPHHSPHPDLALRQTPLISLRRRKGVWQSQCRTELGEPGELGDWGTTTRSPRCGILGRGVAILGANLGRGGDGDGIDARASSG
jgi:hypothetical protein